MMNFVIFGHTVGVKKLLETIPQLGGKVSAIFTHPRAQHKADLDMYQSRKAYFGEYAYDIFDVPEKFGIPVFDEENMNHPEVIDKVLSFHPDVALSIGSRTIFNQTFIKAMPRIANMHPFHLPYWRGAALDTWMILNGAWDTWQKASCHEIIPNIDQGGIIAQEPYFIDNKSYPVDIFKKRMDVMPQLMTEVYKKIEVGESAVPQDESVARYFPRLFTPRDGKINFERFHGEEIVRFIYGFGYPYAGAHCFLGEKKVHILEADFVSDDTPYHSFGWGLIIGRNENWEYQVLVNGGILTVKKIECEGEEIPVSKIFRLGKQLT